MYSHPVDNITWSVFCKRVYRTKIPSVNELQRRINREWALLRHAVIEHAVDEWRQRIRSCVRAGGGHFSTCCNKHDVMWRVTFSETLTASRVWHYSINHSNVHLIIALTAQSDTSNFPRLCKHTPQVKWALYVHFCSGLFLDILAIIFNEISSCLIDPEQKDMLGTIFWDTVYIASMSMILMH